MLIKHFIFTPENRNIDEALEGLIKEIERYAYRESLLVSSLSYAAHQSDQFFVSAIVIFKNRF